MCGRGFRSTTPTFHVQSIPGISIMCLHLPAVFTLVSTCLWLPNWIFAQSLLLRGVERAGSGRIRFQVNFGNISRLSSAKIILPGFYFWKFQDPSGLLSIKRPQNLIGIELPQIQIPIHRHLYGLSASFWGPALIDLSTRLCRSRDVIQYNTRMGE